MPEELMHPQGEDYQAPEEQQAQPETKKGKLKLIHFILYGIPCLIILYVLSIGPVFWLYKANNWDFASFHTIYAPISWLHDNTVLKGILDWYIGLYDL